MSCDRREITKTFFHLSGLKLEQSTNNIRNFNLMNANSTTSMQSSPKTQTTLQSASLWITQQKGHYSTTTLSLMLTTSQMLWLYIQVRLLSVRTNQLGALIDHSTGKRCIFYSFEWFPHDPNFTASLIFGHLFKTLDQSADRPRKLYLQLDNCARENKNWVVFAMLGYIVAKLKWFESVQVRQKIPKSHQNVLAIQMMVFRSTFCL